MNMRLPAQLSRRRADSHKGDYGRILILAGSRPYVGAPCLSAESALRSGAGLVVLGVPQGVYGIVASKVVPEAIILPLPQTRDATFSRKAVKKALDLSKCADCVLLGPGLSVNREVRDFVFLLIESLDVPLILDADGLNCIASRLDILKYAKSDIILTPHPGEMALLCGTSIKNIQNNRKKVAKDFSVRYNVTLVLKGHGTLVASSKGDIYKNSTGNPGMATAGSGDCLVGIVSAFIAQGVEAYEAACSAVYVHGLAGDLAKKDKTEISLVASDINKYLPRAFKIIIS